MRKIGLLVSSLLASAAIHAEVTVDEKPLSGAVQTRAVATPPPLQSQPMDGNPAVQWDLYQQVQQLQQEVRQLRGHLEVQANQIERLKQDSRTRYIDLDQRITQLGTRIPATPTAESAPAAPATTTTAPVLTAGQPAATEAPKPAAGPDDDKKAYFSAYEVYRSGGPNKAINPMREFIKTFPQSSYIPAAYYWLGEFYLAASPADVNNARKSFRILVEQFADAPKVPAALYKLASLADVDGKTSEAARYLQDILKRFPDAKEAAAARLWLKEHQIAPATPEKPKAAGKPESSPAKPAVPASKPAKPETKAAKTSDKPEKAKTSP